MINNTFKDIFFDGSILALEKSSKKKKKSRLDFLPIVCLNSICC